MEKWRYLLWTLLWKCVCTTYINSVVCDDKLASSFSLLFFILLWKKGTFCLQFWPYFQWQSSQKILVFTEIWKAWVSNIPIDIWLDQIFNVHRKDIHIWESHLNSFTISYRNSHSWGAIWFCIKTGICKRTLFRCECVH